MTHRPSSDEMLAAFASFLCRIYQRDHMTLTPEMRLENIPMVDSLGLMQAVALLEEQFQVEFDVATLDCMFVVQDVLNALAEAHPMNPVRRADGSSA